MSVEMSPRHFRRWRKNLGLSQKGAAKALGLKTRMVQYYEKGERDGKKVEVPLSIRLACWALQNGIGDFDGVETHALQPDTSRNEGVNAGSPKKADASTDRDGNLTSAGS